MLELALANCCKPLQRFGFDRFNETPTLPAFGLTVSEPFAAVTEFTAPVPTMHAPLIA